MKRFALFSVTTLALAASAWADPFPGADVAAGQRLIEQKCTSCHAQKMGGDASKIYARPESRIKSAALLSRQVERCSRGELSKAEITNIEGWLNKQYYHFE